jgi:uncharacterized delta-60 repeat protein
MRAWTFKGGAGALLLAGVALATGTAGTLDPGFGTGGVVVASNPDTGQLLGVAAQADGKVVAVGQALNPQRWRIRRFNADGSADTAFDAAADVGLAGGVARRVVLDGSGRIVVAGNATTQKVGKNGKTTTVAVTALVRLLSDGSLDSTFGTTGKAFADNMGIGALALQADGKILVGGSNGTGLVIRRFLTGGGPDTSFGSGGTVVDNPTPGPYAGDDVRGLAVQSTGRIVAACRLAQTSSNPAAFWAVRRYTSNGTLDTSFGSGGMVTSPGDSLHGVAVDASDRIVAAGSRLDSDNISDAGLVVRYTSSGAVDTSFATAGEFLTGIPGHDAFLRVSLLSDGRIVLFGKFGSPEYAYIARLDSDGAPDTDYGGGDGFGDTVQGSGFYDMAVDADGNAVAGGRPNNPDEGDVTTWVLARWLGN